jgi:DNA ligase (NAD+)
MAAVSFEQERLTNFLIRCCYWYYAKADPIISDYEFDMEYKRLEKLEEETGNPMPDSPTQKIWGDSESQYPDWAKER